MIKAVIFDIDGTLVDNDAAERAAVQRIRRSYKPLSAGSETEVGDIWRRESERFFEEYINGRLTFNEQRVARVQAVFEHFGETISRDQASVVFNRYLHEYEVSWTLYEDVLPCLDSLKKYKLAVVSNGDSLQQRAKLSRTGLLDYFNPIVISADINVAKPDSRIFEYCLLRLGLRREESVYVGDSYEKDMVGARNAGILGVMIDREKKKEDCMIGETRVINSLSDIWAVTSLPQYVDIV